MLPKLYVTTYFVFLTSVMVRDRKGFLKLQHNISIQMSITNHTDEVVWFDKIWYLKFMLPQISFYFTSLMVWDRKAFLKLWYSLTIQMSISKYTSGLV